MMARVAVLVEGKSDREAVLALGALRGLDLHQHSVIVVSMNGITNVARHIAQFAPNGEGLHLTGLYDAAEERFVRRGLELGGFAPGPGREDMAAIGFHCCDRDLEDELIRALGVDRVLAILDSEHDLGSFRTLQHQPAHRGGSPSGQLHRFFGAGSLRKFRYGRLLVEALADSEIPPPLVALLQDALVGSRDTEA